MTANSPSKEAELLALADCEGARLANWLSDYSQDLIEDGDGDQGATELNKAAQWIADRLASTRPDGLGGAIGQAAAKFVMWALMEGSWQGADIDGGAAQDKAEALGLITATAYDPAKHGESDCSESGDTWYVPSADLVTALAAKPPAAEPTIQIQARPANGGAWTDIFPAQVQWMCKEGHEIRALESPAIGEVQEVLERVAKIVEGDIYKEHYRMWPQISTEGNRSTDSEIVKHCDKLAAIIRGLASPLPAGERSREEIVRIPAVQLSPHNEFNPETEYPGSYGPALKAARTQWPSTGCWMTFLGKNGYDFEREASLKIFSVGQRYEVEDCNVGNWSHSIKFSGIDGWHNGVMFELCALSPTPLERNPVHRTGCAVTAAEGNSP